MSFLHGSKEKVVKTKGVIGKVTQGKSLGAICYAPFAHFFLWGKHLQADEENWLSCWEKNNENYEKGGKKKVKSSLIFKVSHRIDGIITGMQTQVNIERRSEWARNSFKFILGSPPEESSLSFCRSDFSPKDFSFLQLPSYPVIRWQLQLVKRKSKW